MPPLRAIYELSVTLKNPTAIQSEIVKSVLLNGGFKLNEIIESREHPLCSFRVYRASLKKLKKYKKYLCILNLKNLTVKISKLYRHRWLNAWKKDFKPFFLTRDTRIVPAWQQKTIKIKRQKDIFIDTSLAFGSGLHESTQLISQMIEDKKETLHSFLDLGTGTGILALLASKYGAKQILAVDHSRHVIETAEANFKRNSFLGCSIKNVDINRLKVKSSYDFVSANLFTEVLIDLREKILSFVKQGGYLAVSGISKENYPHFQSIYKKLPLRILKTIKGDHWVAVSFQKKW